MRIRAYSDPDLAALAGLIGDPSRAAIMVALMDGRALPAGDLARRAGISPQTASAHLDRLFRGNLLAVEVQGRHHYYRLHDERVARLVEAMATIAPAPPVRTPAQRDAARTLRFARTCYGHLAGALGVALTGAIRERGYLNEADAAFVVTAAGDRWFRNFGIDLDALRGQRRPLARRCLDWSERRHHLAGALGVAIASRCFDNGWIARVRDSRAVRLTDRGREAMRREFSLKIDKLSISSPN